MGVEGDRQGSGLHEASLLLGVALPDLTRDRDLVRAGARGESWWELSASVGSIGVRYRKRDGSQGLQAIKSKPAEPEVGAFAPPTLFDHHPDGRGERGEIKGFSSRSRVRMLRSLAAVDWVNESGIPEMVTLTYPKLFPMNGFECKAHLQAFFERHRRKWGDVRCAWKQEFQRRGAPHFHLYIFRPAATPIAVYRAWVAQAWFEIVANWSMLEHGTVQQIHLQAGTAVDQQFCSKVRSSRMIAWYFAKHNLKGDHSKAYQNETPKGFVNCGRFWGIVGLESTEQAVAVDKATAVAVMRAVRRYRRAQTAGGRKINLRSATYVWSLVNAPADFLRRLLDQAEAETAWVNRRTGELVHWPPGLRRPLP